MMLTNRSGERMGVREPAALTRAALQTAEIPQRILIASASCETAHPLADALRKDGHQVMLAHERGLALRLVVWQLPSLVVLDTQLAGDDGIALCASLKRDARTRHIPIILTADAWTPDEQLRCVEAGADDYRCRGWWQDDDTTIRE